MLVLFIFNTSLKVLIICNCELFGISSWKPLNNFTQRFYCEVGSSATFADSTSATSGADLASLLSQTDACKMEQNIFYLQTKFIIETVLRTAADVIGTAKVNNTTGEPNVRREVRFASARHPANCSFSSLVRVQRYRRGSDAQ